MQPSYIFIDHTADVLFQAKAATLCELFIQCGLALEDTQVDVKSVEHKKTTKITGENKNIEHLLFDFLDDLLFYKDAERLVFSKFDVTVEKEGEVYKLYCIAHGENIDFAKHDPKVDVKAITMHMFEVKEIEGGFFAQVLVDI